MGKKLKKRYSLEERMKMEDGPGTGRSAGSNKRIKRILHRREKRKMRGR